VSEMIQAVAQPLFVKKKHELADLFKIAERGSKDAVELLIATMNRPEAEVGLKVKLDCAEVVAGIAIKLADQINKDTLHRQVAEFKARGASTPLELERGKPKAPRTDFLTIQEVR